MMNNIKLDEIKNLVTFRKIKGKWVVDTVKSNVKGNIVGTVGGDVVGTVMGNVGDVVGNVLGKIGGKVLYDSESEEPFADVSWCALDVKRYRPKWSDEQCVLFLKDCEDSLQLSMIQRGHDFIKSTLLKMAP